MAPGWGGTAIGKPISGAEQDSVEGENPARDVCCTRAPKINYQSSTKQADSFRYLVKKGPYLYMPAKNKYNSSHQMPKKPRRSGQFSGNPVPTVEYPCCVSHSMCSKCLKEMKITFCYLICRLLQAGVLNVSVLLLIPKSRQRIKCSHQP